MHEVVNLAQIPAADPQHLQQFLIIGFGLLAAASTAVAIWGQFRTKRGQVEITKPIPNEPGESWANAEICNARHEELHRRLHQLEESKAELWRTMRAEDADIRKTMDKQSKDFERAIGRIEGKLDALMEAQNVQYRPHGGGRE